IINNLIMNSLIHGYKNEHSGVINLQIKLSDNRLHLDYSDDGVGLSDEGESNIFEPFYTTNRGAGGSGLGAHIVFNIVTQLLKGSITMNRELVRGLGFHIEFPIMDSEQSIKIQAQLQ
ncbi:MAG: ATP-binding protein, partial [Psychromonas sp.]|nr:ATP-binding protein [Psychromonas sp.]